MIAGLFARRPPRLLLLALLLLALGVFCIAAWSRGTEYDENYTAFLASGTPRPDWPAEPFRAGDVRHYFHGHAGPWRIAMDLRQTDVHPPLYFWAAAGWRAVVGETLYGTRLLSVLCSLLALGFVAAIARRLRLPPALSVLLLLGCYGFTYTGIIARGFALAQCLTLAGIWLLLRARGRRSTAAAFLGGLLLGLATLANYLAAFVAAAALLWLLWAAWRRPRLWLLAGFGFAILLPLDLWFFLAQRGSRGGQFPPFAWLPSLARLGQYLAANLVGGLPLYAGGAARLAVAGGLAGLLAVLVALVAWHWRRIGASRGRVLLLLAALAPPLGLLLLGLLFDNTPIELRYIAFATPFIAMLLAGAIAATARPWRGIVLAALLLVQALSLAGMMTRPETMQPQSAATRAAAAAAGEVGLVVVPHGNDGVGVAGAVLHDAPDRMRVLVVRRHADAAVLAARLAVERRVVLLLLGLDDDSRATLPVMLAAAANRPCWRVRQENPHWLVLDHGC